MPFWAWLLGGGAVAWWLLTPSSAQAAPPAPAPQSPVMPPGTGPLPVVGPTNVPPGAYAPDSPGSWTLPANSLAFGNLYPQSPSGGIINPQPPPPPAGGGTPIPSPPAFHRRAPLSVGPNPRRAPQPPHTVGPNPPHAAHFTPPAPTTIGPALAHALPLMPPHK